jgi:peptide/nickel transport system permease protein
MLSYIIRRLLLGALTLWVITFLVFGLARSMPGTPLTMKIYQQTAKGAIRKEDLKRLERLYGLDKPWPVAYGVWMTNLLQGDLGQSISRNGRPVSEMIGERIGPTLLLSITSLFLSYLLAIPLGLYSTVRSDKLDERTTSTLLYMVYSLPSFVAALYLQILFAVKLDLLPLYRMKSDGFENMSLPGQAWDIMLHMILPVTCFTYGSLAYYARFVKSNMQEVVRQDYIRTARAKGVGPVRVIVHHAFRNTLIPMVTMIGLTLPVLLSGAIILERIFVWPGMGTLFFEALTERDYPTINALVLIFASLTLAGQLLADILYAVVDPRVSYS